jgi:inosine-uridine nucleoside N-ribohydrolase
LETRDPDDALTLCLLATHPRLRLAAVTVNPGTPQQIAVVREILRRLERSGLEERDAQLRVGCESTGAAARQVGSPRRCRARARGDGRLPARAPRGGKLLHDPLAACAILDRDAFQWKEVEVLYERGQRGANLRAGTSTFITVALDPAGAETVLFR